jgi:predicted dehydrogenase
MEFEMKTYKIGLIGCGGRLRGLMKEFLTNSEQLKIVAVYDKDERSVAKAKEELNPELVAYDSLDKLVNDPEIEWVMIGSWNCYHREHAIAAFEAGKNVFCEKPLATNLEDCLAIREAWKKSGKKFVIGFTLRYSAHYHKIKELIDNGEIGKLVSVEFNETLGFNHGGYIHGDWRRLEKFAGTHLLEKCCHDIDLANWIFGGRASRVASFGGVDFFKPENAHYIEKVGKDENGKDAYCTWPGLVSENPFTSEKDVIDNQIALIEYDNGVRATFHTNCNAGIPERRMYILGTEGAIRADVIPGIIEMQKIGFNEELKKIDAGVSGGHGGGDIILCQKLAETIIDDTVPYTTLEDGLTSAITCFGIDEAMKTGKVIDMNPWWDKAGL